MFGSNSTTDLLAEFKYLYGQPEAERAANLVQELGPLAAMSWIASEYEGVPRKKDPLFDLTPIRF
jgi:hypothetical protein